MATSLPYYLPGSNRAPGAAAGLGVVPASPSAGLTVPMLALVSPGVAVMRSGRPQAGIGQTDPSATGLSRGTAFAVGAALLALQGLLSYQIGKAIAPSGASAKKWAWIGVPVGMFTGTLGLGIMAVVSTQKETR